MREDDTLDRRPPDEPVTDGTTPARLLVNVADLRRWLGQRRLEPVEIGLAPLSVVGSRTTSEPVRGEVIVESIERGVSVTGTVAFVWEGDCRRCLEVTGGLMEVDITEIFQVDAPDDSELINLVGDQIDLVPVVLDAVLLSLPLVPLCREDCAGPDPDRYPALTVDEIERLKAQESAETVDSRWADLDRLDLDQN